MAATSSSDGKECLTLLPALVKPAWLTGMVVNARSAIIAVSNFAPTG